jgi:hypothetical protein
MKTTIIIAAVLCILFSSSFLIYQNESKALNSASKLISKINLNHYTQRGMVFREKKNFKAESLDNFNKELNDADLLFEDEPKKALAAYELILSKDPGNLKTHLHLGMLYLKLRQCEAAKEHLFFVYDEKLSSWKADSAWFLSLLFIMENNPEKSKNFLKISLDELTNYRSDAEKLLSKL